jgi:hypothetical protein
VVQDGRSNGAKAIYLIVLGARPIADKVHSARIDVIVLGSDEALSSPASFTYAFLRFSMPYQVCILLSTKQ